MELIDMGDWFKTPEGKRSLDEWFRELQSKDAKRDLKIRLLEKKFSKNNPTISSHIQNVVLENLNKIKYCEEHTKGYELTENGEYCEISPTDSFDLLFSFFQKNGKSMKTNNTMFLSDRYLIENEGNKFIFELYQGQGCFFRLFKDNELLIQI